jgi:DNA-binding LytR/AlgR family response regulator
MGGMTSSPPVDRPDELPAIGILGARTQARALHPGRDPPPGPLSGGIRTTNRSADRAAEFADEPRVTAYATETDAAANRPEMIAVTLGGTTRMIRRDDVRYVQAQGDYARLHTDEASYLVRVPMADLERQWADAGFVRVHRGFVVNLRRAVEVRPRLNGTAVLVMADGDEVPIARRQVGELRRKLGV